MDSHYEENRPRNTGNDAAQRKRQTNRKSARSKSKVWKVIGTLAAIGFLTGTIMLCIFMLYVKTTLASEVNIDASAYTLKQTSMIYYQDTQSGEWKEYQKLYRENRTLVDFDVIPEHVWKALVAIEDKRFFDHHGVDWKRTAAAVVNMFTGNDTFGGSTITQQVIKNLTTDNKTTVKRKVTEIFRALEFEKKYTKNDILEIYLNTVYFGNGAYGIQAAAHSYFGKDVSELTIAQGACIVGITKYPYMYDPARGDWYREQNRERQLTVLNQMYEQKMITKQQYDDAVAEEMIFTWDDNYVPPASAATENTEPADSAAAAEETEGANSKYNNYFVDQVINDVRDDLIASGLNGKAAYDMIYEGGLKIYATVNPSVQDVVDNVYYDASNLNYTSANGYQLQSAITVMDPHTGNIVAMGGGIGEKEGNLVLNRATSLRPCGSAIKPLSVYAPALDAGVISPATVMDDYPIELQENSAGRTVAYPKNSYNYYMGLTTLQTALKKSTNTIAMRTLMALTVPASYEFMTNKLGFTSLVNADLDRAPLALGGLTVGVSTEEMAAAYSSFANDGVYNRPRTYVQVMDNNGSVVLDNPGDTWVAMKETTAYLINQLLTSVVSSGTGTSAAFSGMTIAGKTGTTNNNYDRYFVGYTPYYCAAVWIGYDEMEKISASGNPAALLWKKVMSQVHSGLTSKNFDTPATGLTSVTVCTKSGKLASDLCAAAGDTQTVQVAVGTEPTELCTMHTSLDCCSESGCAASDYCPADKVTSRILLDYERRFISVPGGGTKTVTNEDGTTSTVATDGYVGAEDDDLILQIIRNKGACPVHTAALPTTDPEDGTEPGTEPGGTDPTNPTDPGGQPSGGDTGTTPSTPPATDPPKEDGYGTGDQTRGGLDWLFGSTR